MSPAVSTELRGWAQALSTAEVWLALVWRLAGAALCTAAGAVGSWYVDPLVVLLGVPAVIVVASLARLRVTGRV
jgi:hypothetical protein